MPAYRDLDGDSGIISYRYGADWIEVEFDRGPQRCYTYTYASAGAGHIEQMKRFADAGEGLNTTSTKTWLSDTHRSDEAGAVVF